jgi:hypothetical protein
MRKIIALGTALILAIIPMLTTSASAYTAGAAYTWAPGTPNYNPSATIHTGIIDTSNMGMGDFLGIGPGQPNAPSYGDSGAIVNWDDNWVSWVGHANTNGDNLDGLWAQIIYPATGWWDMGFKTDEFVVFLSQDHGPYLAEGLETRVYGSNTLWGAASSQAVLTDVYLDGWRTHNPAEDVNGNGWCSDDIAGVYQLPGEYRYVKIAAWVPHSGLNEPEVDAVAAIGSIDKTVVPDYGDLGDILTVTLNVGVPAGLTMEVEDHLPNFLQYLLGTFEVDGLPVIPTVENGVISTIVGPGDHTITFDVIVDSVEEMPVTDTNWAYLKYNDEVIDEDSEDITVYPYCGFHKWAYLLSTEDGDEILEVGENIVWRLVIWVTNLYDWTMTDVVVTDRLAAELEIDEVELVTHGLFTSTKKGNIKMTWTIGDLEPGETATLMLQISTKMHKGKQKYTSPGHYELNSGATLKFKNPDGIQLSAHTGPIEFDVPGEWPEFNPYCVQYPESGNLYVGYEDWPNGDFDYNDFGMRFSFVEYYNINWDLVRVTMNFEAIIYDSGMDHLIHIERPINGQSIVDVVRPNPRPSAGPILGKDETPAGTYLFTGDVDVILYNTNKYTHPEKQIGEYVTVDITVVDPTLNPKVALTPPRMFTNEAPMPFYDMDAVMANYDPWEEGTLYGSLFHIHDIQSTAKFGTPSIEVPYILVVPYTDWIPPWESTTITGPYGYFDDFYRYGTPANWYHPSMCTNNAVGAGGLSWGPYT